MVSVDKSIITDLLLGGKASIQCADIDLQITLVDIFFGFGRVAYGGLWPGDAH